MIWTKSLVGDSLNMIRFCVGMLFAKFEWSAESAKFQWMILIFSIKLGNYKVVIYIIKSKLFTN
jgi:hypothetical protein